MALATQRVSQRDSGRYDKEDGRHTGRQQADRRADGLALQTALLFGPTTMLCRHLGARGRRVRFGDGVTRAILRAEDLTVFKVIFDRAKDWTDIDEMLSALGADFDGGYGMTWLRKILDAGDAQIARIDAVLRHSQN